MKSLKVLIFIAMLLIVPRLAVSQNVEFLVEHDRALRNKQGTLSITPERIEYKSTDGKETRTWPYEEIRQIKVEAKMLELTTYEADKLTLGRDHIFKFRLLKGEITPEISELLIGKARRPVTTSVFAVTKDAPVFTVPVQHQHAFGACQGVLKFYPDSITFDATAQPDHSRIWSYRDIQTFSQPDRYRFEITTYELKPGGPSRSFNFELKEELPKAAYDYIWDRVNPTRPFSDQKPGRTSSPSANLPTAKKEGQAQSMRVD